MTGEADALAGELERAAKGSTPGPWEYEPDQEGWTMGSIGYQKPAGRGHVHDALFEVNGDSAEQAINAELVVALVNNLPRILAALSRQEPDAGAVERVAFVIANARGVEARSIPLARAILALPEFAALTPQPDHVRRDDCDCARCDPQPGEAAALADELEDCAIIERGGEARHGLKDRILAFLRNPIPTPSEERT